MNQETQKTQNDPEEKIGRLGTFESLSFFVFDFLKVFVIAVAIIIPIRWFLFQPFVVTGESMLPNFQDRNYLIIDEITYRLREPERGEVVVMRFPNDPSQFFIKRIIALPGERVLVENGRVKIFNKLNPDGLLLDEQYLPENNITDGNINKQLRSDEFFVLGDNRRASSDSRFWGALPRKDIVGRVYIRLLPLQKLKLFSLEIPSYPLP